MTTARKYGCYNRAPFKDQYVKSQEPHNGLLPGEVVLKVIEFRMKPGCEYTKTKLGQIDIKCEGCKHRMSADSAKL